MRRRCKWRVAVAVLLLTCFISLLSEGFDSPFKSTLDVHASSSEPTSWGPINFSLQGPREFVSEFDAAPDTNLYYLVNSGFLITITASAPARSHGTLECNTQVDEGENRNLQVSSTFQLDANAVSTSVTLILHYEDPVTNLASEFWSVYFLFITKPVVTVNVKPTTLKPGETLEISGMLSPAVVDNSPPFTLNVFLASSSSPISVPYMLANKGATYVAEFSPIYEGDYTVVATLNNNDPLRAFPVSSDMVTAKATTTFTVARNSQQPPPVENPTPVQPPDNGASSNSNDLDVWQALFGDALTILVILVIIIFCIVGAWLYQHPNKSQEKTRQATPQLVQSGPLPCPFCGKPLTYVPQYQQWYCQTEQKYV